MWDQLPANTLRINIKISPDYTINKKSNLKNKNMN